MNKKDDEGRREVVQRYSMSVAQGFGGPLVQYTTDHNGEWVRYADVAALTAPAPEAQQDDAECSWETPIWEHPAIKRAQAALAAAPDVAGETPRTDGAVLVNHKTAGGHEVVHADSARGLERELAAMQSLHRRRGRHEAI